MAQDIGTYWFVLRVDGWGDVPVTMHRFGERDFDGDIVFQMSVINDGPTVTFKINNRHTHNCVAIRTLGSVDVEGKFGAYLTDFSVGIVGREVIFSYELEHDGRFPIYDYVTEVFG